MTTQSRRANMKKIVELVTEHHVQAGVYKTMAADPEQFGGEALDTQRLLKEQAWKALENQWTKMEKVHGRVYSVDDLIYLVEYMLGVYDVAEPKEYPL